MNNVIKYGVTKFKLATPKANYKFFVIYQK
jgi:hypothetical protein